MNMPQCVKVMPNFLAGSFENAQLQRFNSSIDYEDPDFVMEIPHGEQQSL